MSKLWLKSGKVIVNANGEPILCDTCPCEEAAPCVCPAGLGTCYRLKDYNDGDIAPCSDCHDMVLPVWDGSFDRWIDCVWQLMANVSMSGKLLTGSTMFDSLTRIILRTVFYPGDCRWELRIACYGGASLIWLGFKTTGLTPAGTYTRSSGCDATSALEVEECP